MSTFSDVVERYEEENKKFEAGNAAAGTRARKHLMDLIKLANIRRKGIQAVKNAK